METHVFWQRRHAFIMFINSGCAKGVGEQGGVAVIVTTVRLGSYKSYNDALFTPPPVLTFRK